MDGAIPRRCCGGSGGSDLCAGSGGSRRRRRCGSAVRMMAVLGLRLSEALLFDIDLSRSVVGPNRLLLAFHDLDARAIVTQRAVSRRRYASVTETPGIFVDLLDATIRSSRNYHRLDHCSHVEGLSSKSVPLLRGRDHHGPPRRRTRR